MIPQSTSKEILNMNVNGLDVKQSYIPPSILQESNRIEMTQ